MPQRQRLQPKFMTDSIRNFIHTMHNRDNTKLRNSHSYRDNNGYNLSL